MCRPFAWLMERVAEIDPESQITLSQLAQVLGEPVERIADAIDAVRVVAGEPGYIALEQPRAPESPLFACVKCGVSLLRPQSMAGSPPRPYWTTLVDGKLGFHCPAGGGHERPEPDHPPDGPAGVAEPAGVEDLDAVQTWLDALPRIAAVASDCFMRNHDGRIRHHDDTDRQLRAERDHARAAAVVDDDRGPAQEVVADVVVSYMLGEVNGAAVAAADSVLRAALASAHLADPA